MFCFLCLKGDVIPGRPDARMIAYARGYAGCGIYCARLYKRSYGRMYEFVSCTNSKDNDKYETLFQQHPRDIIGMSIRLEVLQVQRHLSTLYTILSGIGELTGTKSFDPNDVWGFELDGPFYKCHNKNNTKNNDNSNEAEGEELMKNSFVFQRKSNEAGFAIINNVTDRVLGFILLTKDDPLNLSIQLEAPVLLPSLIQQGSIQQLESCFLLMDRLFGYGYRRIQMSIDTADIEKRKLCTRLGYTYEGTLYKHMIVKNANRDSELYSIINSDWYKGGARAVLYKKLYGMKLYTADATNEKIEQEHDEKQRILLEQQQQQQVEGQKKKQ